MGEARGLPPRKQLHLKRTYEVGQKLTFRSGLSLQEQMVEWAQLLGEDFTKNPHAPWKYPPFLDGTVFTVRMMDAQVEEKTIVSKDDEGKDIKKTEKTVLQGGVGLALQREGDLTSAPCSPLARPRLPAPRESGASRWTFDPGYHQGLWHRVQHCVWHLGTVCCPVYS
jgi:hypothetical protein